MYNDDNTTTIIDAMLYSMVSIDPVKAIENQEKRGQQAVVKNQRLPKKSNDYSLPENVRMLGVTKTMDWEEKNKITTNNNIEYTRQKYEEMGIIIIDEFDDLFWNVKLPAGWEIKATDHTMWNDLIDNKGKKRITFFYKAAFYDRTAFTNFLTRFSIEVTHTADEGVDYDIWRKSDYQGKVKDGDTVIYSTACIPPSASYSQDNEIKNILREELEIFMQNNYPNYKDFMAYWD